MGELSRLERDVHPERNLPVSHGISRALLSHIRFLNKPAYPALAKMSAQISKRRKFIADGVFRAELDDFFTYPGTFRGGILWL